jgi:ribonuclease P protein component
MIARRARFHGYGSLKRVYQHGETARASQLSLRFAARPAGRGTRVAVVVSKKVHKSAVVRNRIRRRIYEQVRLSSIQLDGVDLVFTAFSEQLAMLETPQLTQTVQGLLQKADEQLKKTA